MNNINVPTCPPTSLSMVGDKKTSLEVSKTLEKGTVPDCPYLSSINALINTVYIRKTNDSISKTNSRDESREENNAIENTIGKSGGQQGQEDKATEQQSPTKEDLLLPVIAKYPDLSTPENRQFARSLCAMFHRPFTPSGIEWLERFYRQAGLDVWKFVRGETQWPTPPRGMVGSGVFFADCEGRAIKATGETRKWRME